MSRQSRRRRPRRWVTLLSLLLGLSAGVGLGLSVSWALWPVEYTDVGPDSLYPAHREEYILLIAQSYAQEHDLGAAEARLAALGDPETASAEAAALAERYVRQEPGSPYAEAMARLALDMGHNRTVLVAYVFGVTPIATWTPVPTGTPEPTAPPEPTFTPTGTATPTETPTPTPTETPTETPTSMPTATHTATPVPTDTTTPQPPTATPGATSTPVPTWTPTPTSVATATPRPTWTPTLVPTPEPRFDVVQMKRRCDLTQEQLMVMVLDAAGQQLPNVELLVRWDGGEDRFVTGLKPDIGLGYADFDLERGHTYQLVVIGAASQLVQNIVAEPCEGASYLATWQVTLQWTGEIESQSSGTQ
jgi:hypothetical protein